MFDNPKEAYIAESHPAGWRATVVTTPTTEVRLVFTKNVRRDRKARKERFPLAV
jgi:hypothetical protein